VLVLLPFSFLILPLLVSFYVIDPLLPFPIFFDVVPPLLLLYDVFLLLLLLIYPFQLEYVYVLLQSLLVSLHRPFFVHLLNVVFHALILPVLPTFFYVFFPLLVIDAFFLFLLLLLYDAFHPLFDAFFLFLLQSLLVFVFVLLPIFLNALLLLPMQYVVVLLLHVLYLPFPIVFLLIHLVPIEYVDALPQFVQFHRQFLVEQLHIPQVYTFFFAILRVADIQLYHILLYQLFHDELVDNQENRHHPPIHLLSMMVVSIHSFLISFFHLLVQIFLVILFL